jgi:trimethylamine--corrinoid protein Co-methyltransferase
MTIQGIENKNPLKILSDDEVNKIHGASLEILESVGMKFEDEEALKILGDGGCSVDRQKMMVKIPDRVVESALKLCPSSFTQKSRNPKYDLHFDPSRVFFTNHSAPFIRDIDTGEKRVPTLKDVEQLITVMDALENIHAIFVPALNVADRPREVGLEWVVAEVLRKSEKATIGATFGGCAKWVIKMADVVGEDVIGCASAVPPMNWGPAMCRGVITYARSGHITSVCTGVGMGASGPATIAGALVQANAEILAGIVLAQVTRPGVRIATATQVTPLDMRTGELATGSIEAGMVTACLTQMSHHYKLPMRSQFPMTDSKIPDQQAGYEKCMQLMLIAMAGNNYIISAGGIENELSLSFEQLVIDNEVYSMMARYMRGVEITDETMAVDLIKEVSLLGGNFLGKPHTKEWCRKEMFMPRVSDRHPYQSWLKEGSKDVVARAREIAREILKTHEVPPLPADVDKELGRILVAAQEEKAQLA